MSTRDAYNLILADASKPGDAPAVRRLARLLKFALRATAFKCIGIDRANETSGMWTASEGASTDEALPAGYSAGCLDGDSCPFCSHHNQPGAGRSPSESVSVFIPSRGLRPKRIKPQAR